MKKKSASASAGRRRLLQGAALIGAAAVVPSLAANAQNQPKVTVMSADTANKPASEMTADEICKLLQLEPNATCGFVRVTFESKLSIAADGLPAPFADKRPLGSALYFLVTPGRRCGCIASATTSSTIIISAIRLNCSCCAPTAARNGSSSGLTFVTARTCSC